MIRTTLRHFARGALDVLTIMAAAATAAMLLAGPLRAVAWGVPLTARWTHGLLLTLALAALRHAFVPVPSVRATLRTWRDAVRRRPDLSDALLAFWATRPAVLIVGFLAAVTFGVLPSADQPPHPRHALRDLPARFDANWYAGIALDGYDWQNRFDRQQNVAFFPAYPLLMRAGGVVTGAFDKHLPVERRVSRLTWAGLGVSLVAFVFAAFYFARLAREILEQARVRPAVLLLATYPFAAFFSAAYTESFFLLAALATWYHMRRGHFLRAGVWGVLVGLTRPNGFFLGLPLGLIALGWRDAAPTRGDTGSSIEPEDRRAPARWGWTSPAAFAVALTPALGLLLHTLWLYRQTGIWFAWARIQIAWGREVAVGLPRDVLASLGSGGLLQLVTEHPYKALNALGLLFAFGLVWPVWRRLGAAWAAYVLVNVVPPLAAGGVLSMGRLTSTLFPLFLGLAAVLPARAVPVVTVLFAMLQGLVAALFYTWREMY